MFLNLDIYPLILENLNLKNLLNCFRVNKFFSNICKKELEKRLEKIEIVVNEIYIEKIYLLIENRKFKIPEEKYSIQCIEYLLNEWFCYNFHTNEWVINFKICKYINKLRNKNNKYKDIKFLTFKIKDIKSYLIDID